VSNYANGDFETKYGTIHARNPGPFVAYPNLRTYMQTRTRHVVLQGPALRAFKAAEERVATKSKPFILITGSGYRSYDLQKELWDTDHFRYADPDLSNHVEGLAVDVDQGQGRFRLAKVNKALRAEGFVFAVPGEPWHASFHLSG
jgi:hypothetical protein